ncbi:MAG: hypothetical protein WBA51_12110 [Erythrobacter sp.]
MRALFVCSLALGLLGCQPPDSAISDDQFLGLRESHPGMTQACLNEIRYGGVDQWRPDDPDCFEMLPAQRWIGLWEHGWEWTNFCPVPETTCEGISGDGTWLTFSSKASPDANIPDGVHRITFIGRRTKIPGSFGHEGSYKHLMVVDQIIAIEPAD